MVRPSTPFLKWMTALGLLMIAALTLGALRAQDVCDEFMQTSGNAEYASVPLCLAELSGVREAWNRFRSSPTEPARSLVRSPVQLPGPIAALPSPAPTKWACAQDSECTLTGCCDWGPAMLRENYRHPKECASVRCIPSPNLAVCVQNHCSVWKRPEEAIRGGKCSAENCAVCSRTECEQLSERCEIASQREGSEADSVDPQKRKEGKPSLQVYSYSCKTRT